MMRRSKCEQGSEEVYKKESADGGLKFPSSSPTLAGSISVISSFHGTRLRQFNVEEALQKEKSGSLL